MEEDDGTLASSQENLKEISAQPELSRSRRYEEPAGYKSCLDVTAADIGQAVNATPADYRQLTGVDKDLLEKIFGKGRLYKKGRSLAREGYVSDLPINIT